jgi:hypothetical protein
MINTSRHWQLFFCGMKSFQSRSYPLLTHPSTRTRRLFVSTEVSRALLALALVLASAGLSWSLIHRISKSSLRSYDCRRAMMSIMRRFSLVVPSLTSRMRFSVGRLVQCMLRELAVQCLCLQSFVSTRLIFSAISYRGLTTIMAVFLGSRCSIPFCNCAMIMRLRFVVNHETYA